MDRLITEASASRFGKPMAGELAVAKDRSGLASRERATRVRVGCLVIVRIARHADVPQHEVVIARWLADRNFPAARLLGSVPQLQQVDGHVITWWELIDEAPPRPRFADLALALRRLHELPPPRDYTFPEFDPMPRVLDRVKAAGPALSDEDREFLVR